jgi:hypothetical protein
MMYPPCPPWVGWYGPWTPPPMHFHPGWSRPTQGFGHGGYYAGDDRYKHVDHQHDRKSSGQENWTIRNAKPNHPVSGEATVVPNHQQEQKAPTGASVDQLGCSQGHARPGSESSTNSEVKPDVETSTEEVASKQHRIAEIKPKTRTKAGTSSQQHQNQTARFSKLDHPVSTASSQKQASRTTSPGQLQHLIGVLQASCPARGGGSSG